MIGNLQNKEKEADRLAQEKELQDELVELHKQYKEFRELLVKMNQQQKLLEKLLRQLQQTVVKMKNG